jgi:hypothetical protein
LKLREVCFLLLLTAGALLIHGYHPYAEDSAYYLPAVKKLLNPALYPRGAEWFESHQRFTLFPALVAWVARASHLPLDIELFAGHLLTLFLFLVGCWKVSCLCFESSEARWCSVALAAALMTLPAAGTALFLMDQYLNPRSLSTFAALFAVAHALEKRYLGAMVWLFAAGLVHPLMTVFGVFFVVLLAGVRHLEPKAAAFSAILVFGISLGPPSEAYHQAALLHDYHYVNQWAWYGWLGIFGPVGLFYWFSRIARVRRMPNVALLSRSLVPFVLLSLLAALFLDVPRRFEALARFQPMRSMHLAYVLLVVLAGGMLGQFLLKRSAVRWFILFVPLCAGMALVQFRLFPASAHIEWPGVPSRNEWVQAFDWVREKTPTNAYFALDPLHMDIPGEDQQSFRAIAERSMLADIVKDSGAVSMFPQLAEEWWEQVKAQKSWKSFRPADFERLKSRYGVDWVILQQPGSPGLLCPYQNSAVLVCQVE